MTPASNSGEAHIASGSCEEKGGIFRDANDTGYNSSPVGAWCVTELAVQPGMGILSKQWAGAGGPDPAYPVPSRTYLERADPRPSGRLEAPSPA